MKKKFLGEQYYIPGPGGNEIHKTNVPDLRVSYRYQTLLEERNLVLHFDEPEVYTYPGWPYKITVLNAEHAVGGMTGHGGDVSPDPRHVLMSEAETALVREASQKGFTQLDDNFSRLRLTAENQVKFRNLVAGTSPQLLHHSLGSLPDLHALAESSAVMIDRNQASVNSSSSMAGISSQMRQQPHVNSIPGLATAVVRNRTKSEDNTELSQSANSGSQSRTSPVLAHSSDRSTSGNSMSRSQNESEMSKFLAKEKRKLAMTTIEGVQVVAPASPVSQERKL
jgi:hypothetical protein